MMLHTKYQGSMPSGYRQKDVLYFPFIRLSLPHQDDCNTSLDMKKRTTKHRTITYSHNGSYNKQEVNNDRTTALERTAAQATGGGGGWWLKCI